MKTRVLTTLMALLCCAAAPAAAQEKTVTGRVTDEQSAPLPGASVVIRGTTVGTIVGANGNYSIRVAPGQVLQYRMIGTSPVERTVGAENVINVQLRRVATSLDAVVVTALGQTTQQRALGTSQQQVQGVEIAQTQRENFVNALQGRVAGVQVVSTSGTPGASSSITIRGVSSISSSNQPLMIVDGLPIDNKTLNSSVLASDAPGSATAFSNRGVDFTNRASDINPEDIETLTVLKGPEAAALYGIDAANGAIIITTKRGRAGAGGLEYSNSFRFENVRAKPDLQRTYGPSAFSAAGSLTEFRYFGAPYAAGTTFYDNVDGFFRTGVTQKHNLNFSGAAQDNRINYRLASAFTRQVGVVPNTQYDRINLTGASGAQVTNWLKADLSMQYTYANNDKVFKGDGGPFIGLMVWPQTDDAPNYLTAAGVRRRVTALTVSGEIDNPYFSVDKNPQNEKTNRINSNVGLVFTPFSWGDISTRVGADAYTQQNLLLRHPESYYGFTNNGIIDQADDITRIINSQTLLNIHSRPLVEGLSISGTIGNAVQDSKSTVDAAVGRDFLDPNFISVNNANLRSSRQSIAQRRLVSAFASATLAYRDYAYLTVTGRNDWTSTIPTPRNSFFYPGVNGSFILTDAFPGLKSFMTSAKLRAGYAEVGRDARPYAYRPSLEYKTTSYGGYGYGFTGPNLALSPEFARSYEAGFETGYLNDRLGLDLTVYRKQTKDQIVNDIRGSYATGFVLFNLNGAETKNEGIEITLRGTPVQRQGLSWDFAANFDAAHGRTVSLPNALPESYVSDTWLYGDVRNGTKPGLSTMSLTGRFYLRNKDGQLLIDPASGLPLRQPAGTFVDAGYDRQPDWQLGLSNNVKFNRVGLSFLVDFRKGGDVFNATQHFLTTRGLAASTLDRTMPRVVEGVLRDGKENTDTPTKNTIVVVPITQPGYYTGISEELFIEKDINWVRLRDVTLSYTLPERLLRNANVFITGTDLLLLTNYTGLDPISNGTSASVGGSGAVGIDYGNFPIPRGFNFGLKVGF
jgi:TonB-linked SusC/RagA family outer membrane protein